MSVPFEWAAGAHRSRNRSDLHASAFRRAYSVARPGLSVRQRTSRPRSPWRLRRPRRVRRRTDSSEANGHRAPRVSSTPLSSRRVQHQVQWEDRDATAATRPNLRRSQRRQAVQQRRRCCSAAGPHPAGGRAGFVGRVAHVADPEIARLRVRIESGLATTRKALADGTEQVQRQAKAAVANSDRYVARAAVAVRWHCRGRRAPGGLSGRSTLGRERDRLGQARNTSTAFAPPKANELESMVRTTMLSRATLGT